LDIGNGEALRIPLASGNLGSGSYRYTDFIREYLDGYNNLKGSGINLVKVFVEQSHSPYYLVVQNVDTKFDLYEFSRDLVNIQFPERELAAKKLIEFAKSTADWKAIRDCHAGQIRWTGKEWVLMDYMAGAEKAATPTDNSVFSSMFNLKDSFKNKLQNAVIMERHRVASVREHAHDCAARFAAIH
jgi:hypothetical protein